MRKKLKKILALIILGSIFIFLTGCDQLGLLEEPVVDDSQEPSPGGNGNLSIGEGSESETGFTLEWSLADDNVSSSNDLEYLVFYSTNLADFNNISNIESNAIQYDSWQRNISYKNITGLTPGETYYFAVLVMDESFNVSKYETLTITMSGDAGPQDTVPPVITLDGNPIVNLIVGDSYVASTATADDDVDGDITDDILITGGPVDSDVEDTYVLHYNVSDAAGNDAVEVVQTINVLPLGSDITPPEIHLLGDAEMELNANDSFNDPGVLALDSGANITDDVVVDGVVDTSTAGTYILSYNVSDAQGNMAITVTRTVVVVGVDTVAPFLVLLGEADILLEVGSTYTEAGTISQDDVDESITVVISGTVDTATPGTYILTYTATDTAGNSAVETRTIVVYAVGADVTAPIITLLGSSTIELTVGDTYAEYGATAFDDVDESITVDISGAVDTATPGTYILTYTATDAAGNSSEETRTVVVSAAVQDTTPPELVIYGDLFISLEVNSAAFVDPGSFAIDNIDGEVGVTVSGDVVDYTVAGTYYITYTAVDVAGNSSFETRTVVVYALNADVIPPEIYLNGLSIIDLMVGDLYTEEGATAEDDVDGDLTADIITAGGVDTTIAGTYVVTYNVSDAAGNAAEEVSRIVEVTEYTYDVTPPELILYGVQTITQAIYTQFNEPGFEAFDDVDGNISDLVVVIGANFDTTTVGTYQITYSVTDSSGNYTIAYRIVNVVDTLVNVAPVANAGTDFSSGPGWLELDGSGSYDPNNDFLDYTWTSISHPELNGQLNTDSYIDLYLYSAGIYQFELTVFDGDLSSSDIVLVTIEEVPPNIYEIVADFPTVYVYGADPTVTIMADFYDNNEQTLSVYWQIISRPAGSTAQLVVTESFNYSSTVTIAPNNILDIGEYEIMLTVTDGTFNVNDFITIIAYGSGQGGVNVTIE